LGAVSSVHILQLQDLGSSGNHPSTAWRNEKRIVQIASSESSILFQSWIVLNRYYNGLGKPFHNFHNVRVFVYYYWHKSWSWPLNHCETCPGQYD
jgi:hypothetical protein